MHQTNLRRKVPMQQQQQPDRGVLLITRSATLIFQTQPAWRGSRQEVWVGGLACWRKVTKRLCSVLCVLQHRVSHLQTLTSWSHKEQSRAWRCQWRCWSSSLLSVAASSAPPGIAGGRWKGKTAGLFPVGQNLKLLGLLLDFCILRILNLRSRKQLSCFIKTNSHF